MKKLKINAHFIFVINYLILAPTSYGVVIGPGGCDINSSLQTNIGSVFLCAKGTSAFNADESLTKKINGNIGTEKFKYIRIPHDSEINKGATRDFILDVHCYTEFPEHMVNRAEHVERNEWIIVKNFEIIGRKTRRILNEGGLTHKTCATLRTKPKAVKKADQPGSED